jgi:peptide/nickel transport system permease protein
MLLVVRNRLPHALLVLFGASLLTFLVMNVLPGDPAIAILGENATPDAVAAVREQLHLDRPLPVRYVEWLLNAIQGDLGQSYNTSSGSVTATILERIPVSLEILLLAQVLALAVAVPVALASVRRPGGWLDRSASIIGFCTLAVPSFLLGLLLILVFSLHWRLLPTSVWVPITEDLVGNLRSAILPAATIAIGEVAIYMRLLRSDLLDTLSEEYVVTAQSKGLTRSRIMRRHVLRNSLFSLVTIVGLNVGALIGGAVITESVFAVPGLGRLLVQAVLTRDLPLVQGVVLFIAVAYVVMNLVVDLAYAALDPRIRRGADS